MFPYLRRRAYDLLPVAVVLPLLVVLAACGSSAPGISSRGTPTGTLGGGASPAATIERSPTATLPPAHYTAMMFVHGFGSPDDLTLDGEGRVLFVDFGNGGVNRVEPDGQITVLIKGLPEPEGLVAEPDGSLLIAVQGKAGEATDKILRLAPGSATSAIFVAFTNMTKNEGLDGIHRDPYTGDILVPDSPNGKVYRVSPDGKQVTLLASGFARPVDAIVDSAGIVYVADEYGNKVARVAPDGTVTTLARLSLPDDLAFDLDGSLLVTSLGDNTLVRLDPASGKKLGVVAGNLHQPQGMVLDQSGNIYVSEQDLNIVLELKRG